MTQERRSKKPIGELLVSDGLLTQGELLDALANRTVVSGRRERLGETILRLGYVDGRDMARVIAQQFDLPFSGDTGPTPSADVADLLDADLSRTLGAVPLRRGPNGELVVLVADPSEHESIEQVRQAAGVDEISLVVGAPDQVAHAHGVLYGGGVPEPDEPQVQPPATPDHVGAGSAVPDRDAPPPAAPILHQPEPTRHAPASSPASRQGVVERLLREAVERGASGLVLRPDGTQMTVRQRVDGALQVRPPLSDPPADQVVAAFATATALNPADHRRPQVGDARFTIEGEVVDLHVLLMPTTTGTAISVGISRPVQQVRGLADLGGSPTTFDVVADTAAVPGALVLIAGPARSGRTTLLHALLAETAGADRDCTLISPDRAPTIPDVGVILAPATSIDAAGRTLMDGGMDVLAIDGFEASDHAGVVRDALRTGRTVLAVCAAVDASAALADLHRADADLIGAAASVCVVSPRLLRAVCQSCTRDHTPTATEVRRLGLRPDEGGWVSGGGCPSCEDTGHDGQVLVAEVAEVDAATLAALRATGAVGAREVLRGTGAPSVRTAAMALARAGRTTLAEAMTTPPPARFGYPGTPMGTSPSPASAPASAGLPLPRRAPGREDPGDAAGIFNASRTAMADQTIDPGERPAGGELGRLDPEKALQAARARLDDLLQGVE